MYVHFLCCPRIFRQSTLYFSISITDSLVFGSVMTKMKLKYKISKTKRNSPYLLSAAIAPNTKVFRASSLWSIDQGQNFLVRATIPVNKQIIRCQLTSKHL